MLNESQKYKLGLFIITGIVVLVVAVFVLTGGQFFRREFLAYSVFEESVQGIEIGSPVKFRGVLVGEVCGIHISSDDLRVRVDMRLMNERLDFPDRAAVIAFITEQIESGLRCRLDYAGITGAKYVEMGYFAKPGEDAPRHRIENDTFFIPSTRSLLSEVTGATNDITLTLAKISSIEFDTLGKDVGELLRRVNVILGDERIPDMIAALDTTARNLQALTERLDRELSDDNIAQLLEALRETLASVRRLANDVDQALAEADVQQLSRDASTTLNTADETLTEIQAAAKDLRGAATAFQETMQDYRGLAKSAKQQVDAAELGATTARTREGVVAAEEAFAELRRIRADLNDTLIEINQAMRAVENLARTIEEDPGALLRGKAKPPSAVGNP